MIKREIEYDNYDGTKVKEPFYFNLTPVEVAELNEEIPGGIDHFKDMLDDNPELIDVMRLFKKLVGKAVAKKRGDRVIKPDGLGDEFVASEAYSTLFFDLWSDANKMTDFLNGIIPISARGKLPSVETAAEMVTGTVEAKPATEVDTPAITTPAESNA